MSASSFPFFSAKRSFDMRMDAIRDRGQPALPRYSYPGRYMEKHLSSKSANSDFPFTLYVLARHYATGGTRPPFFPLRWIRSIKLTLCQWWHVCVQTTERKSNNREWTIFTKRGSGGIMADACLFLARPYIFCVVFLYSRTVKEARLRFSNTALPKYAHGRHYTTTPTLGEYGPLRYIGLRYIDTSRWL